MNAKLSRTNGILSKLCHYVPKKTMLPVYYALFYSHMTNVRIINFATFNEHTNSLFSEDKIIKFPDIKLNQLMSVQQFNNKTLPVNFFNRLKFQQKKQTQNRPIL